MDTIRKITTQKSIKKRLATSVSSPDATFVATPQMNDPVVSAPPLRYRGTLTKLYKTVSVRKKLAK